VAVRDQLVQRPEFLRLPVEDRRALAGAMVGVAERAAELIAQQRVDGLGGVTEPATVSEALAAGDELGMQATRAVATTTRATLQAISFPRFVEELVTGVFRAMTASAVRQMDSFVDLLQNVSASLDGFAARNLPENLARQWLADTYPASFEVSGGEQEEEEEPDARGFEPEPPEPTRLRLRPGASFPTADRLREDLQLDASASVPGGDPEALVPLARRKMAQTRQEMLATMLQLGLQRIVIDGGMVRAGMRFHIDARSAAAEDRANRFNLEHTASGSGSFGAGPWGVSASASHSIGYVTTNQVQTTEEVNAAVDVDSEVEIHFRSDQLPLSSLAGDAERSTIQVKSRNPQFAAIGVDTAGQRKAEAARQDATRKSLGTATPAPPLPPPPQAPKRQETPTNQPPASGNPPAAQPPAQSPTQGKPAGGGQPPAQPPAQPPPQGKPAGGGQPPAQPHAQLPAPQPPAGNQPAPSGISGSGGGSP
jgi:hypothetical protein